MGEILINYTEVSSRTSAKRGQISGDFLPHVGSEHTQLIATLDGVDSGSNAGNKNALDEKKIKTVRTLLGIDRLASFMAHSSVEFEQSEKEIASALNSGAGSVKGGDE